MRPPDSIPRLEHHDRLAGLRQAAGRRQAGVTGADHADVDVETLGHAAP